MKTITTKYHGPTNIKPSRVTASDEDGHRVTLVSNDHDAAAVALCAKMGWTQHNLVRGNQKHGNVYVFDEIDAHVYVKSSK